MATNFGQISGASSAITITLASLASDTNLLAGRASTVYDCTTNVSGGTTPPIDLLISVKITTGTTPTVNRRIEVWVYGSMDDTPNYPDAITGTDANKTITLSDIKACGLRLLDSMLTNATSNVGYYISSQSVAALFGGILPKKVGVFVVHNTAVNLNSTGSNHVITVTPVYLQGA